MRNFRKRVLALGYKITFSISLWFIAMFCFYYSSPSKPKLVELRIFF